MKLEEETHAETWRRRGWRVAQRRMTLCVFVPLREVFLELSYRQEIRGQVHNHENSITNEKKSRGVLGEISMVFACFKKSGKAV